jgi:hypothetical protein
MDEDPPVKGPVTPILIVSEAHAPALINEATTAIAES